MSRKHIPLLATALVLVALFTGAALRYPNFGSLRVITNLFADNAVLGIAAIGMTFVILSGGIDLSVGPVAAFTTAFIATVVAKGTHPMVAILIALVLGTLFGWLQGGLIQR